GGTERAPFFLLESWKVRAGACYSADLPLPATTGEERVFWERFSFTPDAQLYFADGNREAASAEVAAGVSEVWLFDAHHDGGYSSDLAAATFGGGVPPTCQTWLLHYQALPVHMRYPAWRRTLDCEAPPLAEFERVIDDGAAVPGVFERVFLCRSGGWAPPWL